MNQKLTNKEKNMATIQLPNGWRIKSDARQWMLQKPDPRADRPDTWQNVTYHHDIGGAVRSAYDYALRASDADSVAGLLEHSKNFVAGLCVALRPLNITVTDDSGESIL